MPNYGNSRTSSVRSDRPETELRDLLEKLAMTRGLWLAGIVCFLLMQSAILSWQWPITAIAILLFLFLDFRLPESFFKFRPGRPMAVYAMALLLILVSFALFFTTHTARQLGIAWTVILGLIYAIGSWLFLAPLLHWVFDRPKARTKSRTRSEKRVSALARFLDSRNFVWLCAGIGLVCLVLMARQAFSLDVWIDEAFSMELIKKSFWQIFSLTAQDVHPPLYYIFLKIGVSILTFIFRGLNPIFAARLVTEIPYVVLYGLCLTWIWRRFGNFTAGFSLLALFGAPQLFMYTVEIRMYGFSLLWITCIALTIYDLVQNYGNHLKRKELWIRLTIFSLLAAYTHYYAAVAAAICWVGLLWWMWKRSGKKGAIRWAQAAGFCLIFYIPWIFVLFMQMAAISQEFWIESSGFSEIGDYFAFAFGSRFWLLLFFVGLAIFTRKEAAKEEVQFEISSALLPVLLIVFGVILSLLFRPVYIARYVFPTLFVFWIGFGLFAGSITNSRLKILFMLGTMLCSLGTFYNEYQAMNTDRVQAVALARAIDTDTDNKPKDDVVIIVNNTHLWRNLQIELDRPIYLQPDVKIEESITEKVYGKPEVIHADSQIEDLLKKGKSVLLVGAEDSDFDYYENNTNLKVQKISTENYGTSQHTLSIYSVRLKTDTELKQDGQNPDADRNSSQSSQNRNESSENSDAQDSSEDDSHTSTEPGLEDEDQAESSQQPDQDVPAEDSGEAQEPGYDTPITDSDQNGYEEGDQTVPSYSEDQTPEETPDYPADDGSGNDVDNSQDTGDQNTSTFQPPAYIPPVYEDSSNVLN